MSVEMRNSVETWLKEIGCTPVVENDPEANFHFRIDYPVNSPHVMHVVSPRKSNAAVVVATRTDMGHEHIESFQKLDPDSQQDFLWDLRRTVNSTEVDFQFDGAKNPTDCPTAVQISSVRFSDGLTMDSFVRTVGAVFKIELAAIWVIHKHLGSGGDHGPGRFDFRRIGI